MSKIENNPHYQHGFFLGGNVVKHIENTTYGSIDVALERKRELVKDLKEQFGWDETHKDVAQTLGIIAALEAEQKKIEDSKPEGGHKLTIENVIEVADSIGKELDSQRIIEILDDYDKAQAKNPDATWQIIIENLINEL